MTRCKYCNSFVEEDQRFCWNCGRPIDRFDSNAKNPTNSQSTPLPNTSYAIWTTVFLIACFPIGLLIMWVFRPYTKKTRRIISAILVGTSIFGLMMLILWTSSPGYLY